MPKKRSKRRKPRGIRAGLQRRRPLRPTDLPPGLYQGLQDQLGRRPAVGDLDKIQWAAIQEVLKRNTELFLAGWLHTCMLVLRDHFEFKEQDLAQFARLFRDEMAAQQARERALGGTDDQEETPEGPPPE